MRSSFSLRVAPSHRRTASARLPPGIAKCHGSSFNAALRVIVPGGSAFSLLTYLDAQPRANEIKDAVLMRRMPPWGAVKGFGRFRNDVSLSQEQIETITRWVDGGVRRGNNPRQLPPTPTFGVETPPVAVPTLRVSGPITLRSPLVVDGVLPERVLPGQSLRVVAVSPHGSITPLIWLHDFNDRFPHPFLFTSPLTLPPARLFRAYHPRLQLV